MAKDIVCGMTGDESTALNRGATAVAGTVVFAGSVVYARTTAIFNPNSTLLAGTVYTATITNAATAPVSPGLRLGKY